MTRLIDADSIPWLVEGVGEIPVITKEEIDEMPTVDAIPIEFIQKEIEKWDSYGSEKWSSHAMGLRHLIEDWRWAERKDNDTID